MLKDSDLQDFVRLVRRVEREPTRGTVAHPDTILRAAPQSDRLLHRNEYARLYRSLRIASAAGDVPELSHELLYAIVQNLAAEGRCYLSITHSDAWSSAIRWAILQESPTADPQRPSRTDRQFQVGSACQRLRAKGYLVHIGAFGPRLDEEIRTAIARHVDSLIARIGGIAVVQEICRLVAATNNIHDGMWLLGNKTGNHARVPDPELPIGWLLAVALRHIHLRSSTANPAAVWKSAMEVATDFAASMDCQRYNHFDGLNLDACDFLQSLQESLAWRELFTRPQVPPAALSTIRLAFSQIAWPKRTNGLRRKVDDLFAELDALLDRLTVDRLTPIQACVARTTFPRLWEHARGLPGAVNPNYLHPFGAHPCNHDPVVFFQSDDDHVWALPVAITAATGCEAVFRLVRGESGRGGGDIIGHVIEKAVAIGCRAHTNCVHEQLIYYEGKTRLEIDVAVRDGQQLVVFEAKAKQLTSRARTGDMIAFLYDYTNSFLALLRQLVRHDHNIKCGLTSLTQPKEDVSTLRIIKVAVSRLGYGPSSDHVLAGALFRSIVQARLQSVTGNAEHVEVLDGFNKKLDEIAKDLECVTTDEDGTIDLFGYLIDFFWLDLGQLLYALCRGRTIEESLSALKNLTFGTQDFWTEAAFGDRMGLTKKHWRSMADGQ